MLKKAICVLLFVASLTACANSQQRPPSCRGEYRPINTLDHYPGLDENGKPIKEKTGVKKS